MKLVLIMVLIMISVMAVVGTFLVNSVTTYNIDNFLSQMSMVFTPEFIAKLEDIELDAQQPEEELSALLSAYSGALGIDKYRSFYILDAETGSYLDGSDDQLAQTLTLTPNILTAMQGQVGEEIERLSDYFDVAIPINVDEGGGYIVGVRDSKQESNDMNWNLVTILIRAMLFGVMVAVLLSFFLAKTITTPIERLTDQATSIAEGDFGEPAEIYARDEIGILTQTFNEMAGILQDNLHTIEDERSKLNTLFTHMADGVVAFDKTGRIMHHNPEAAKMLGISFSEQTTYSEVFPDLVVQESDMADDGKYIEIDYVIRGRILKIFFAPLRGTGTVSGGIMAVLHDITQQKRLDDARKEFVANVSHELRTPLTNIKGYTETLIDAYDDIDSETRSHFLSVIYNEADRMTRLVKDLLTLTKLDYERMEASDAPVDLRDIAERVAASMEIEARKQGVTIHCDLPVEMPQVSGERDRLQQVVMNIVSNAVKYNQRGGSVTMRCDWQDGIVRLSVADTGLGIPKEDLPRIFERFYRVDKARSREKGGTGLGLAIAREIVEFHGGTITVDSQEGKGTTVVIALPARVSEEVHA
ncbi:MAG: HAMP domain-containing protein [Clostridia bacterium]|nr:HAMP domain-containing protein [Clostridia bacterium]